MLRLDYPIYFADGYGGEEMSLGEAFRSAGLAGRAICVVTDENVARLYLDEALSSLDRLGFKALSFAVPPGEGHKTLRTVESIYGFFLKSGLDRRSAVLALGGGVVGDMAGFAASTYMRGIKFAQAPTTLLSQADASVGGKLGVDFMGAKNLIGVFSQPAFVFINIGALRTLPKEQRASGMAEVVKHGLALDKAFYDLLRERKEPLAACDLAAAKEAVEGSCRIKSEVVALDEKESGPRERLNFGHTFGHAVESLSGFALPHGHCVSIGMAAAMRMSADRGAISQKELDEAEDLLQFFGLPVRVDADPDRIFELMKLDKKNKDGAINVVLLSRIGESHTCAIGGKDELMPAIRHICGRPA
jgi:3-dehydroquinate synthase